MSVTSFMVTVVVVTLVMGDSGITDLLQKLQILLCLCDFIFMCPTVLPSGVFNLATNYQNFVDFLYSEALYIMKLCNACTGFAIWMFNCSSPQAIRTVVTGILKLGFEVSRKYLRRIGSKSQVKKKLAQNQIQISSGHNSGKNRTNFENVCRSIENSRP